MAREWMSEIFGWGVRSAGIAVAWTSIMLLFTAYRSGEMVLLGLVGLAVGVLLVRKADDVVRFTYGRRTEPAIRQP